MVTGGWREEWEIKRYRVQLGESETDHLRVRMQIERGRLVRFVAQYELDVDARIYPVARYDTYDTAHGGSHRDLLNWRGRVIDKSWHANASYDAVLSEAIRDIRAHWRVYRERFERMKP